MSNQEVFTMRKQVIICCSIFLSFIFGFAEQHHSCAEASDRPATKHLGETVRYSSKSDIDFQLAAITAPTTPAVLVRKVICNYLLPVNDYVAFEIPYGGIALPAASGSNNYNSIMINFEVTPTVPVFIWLQQNASSGQTTTPVYVNDSSCVIPLSSNNSWFYIAGGPYTMLYLCIQGIYPTPPPASYYYPVSCTIVYQ
jgi:hypothetical protein